MSTDGLRRLLSVVEPPSPRDSTPPAPAKDAASEKDTKVSTSQEYYKAVKKIIQILDNKITAAPAATLPTIANWMKRDSIAIRRLPILNVDPDLVTFASEISVRLNDAARVMLDGTLQTNARTAGIQNTHVDTYYGTGGLIYGDKTAQINESAQRRAAAAQTDAQRRTGREGGTGQDDRPGRRDLQGREGGGGKDPD